MFYSLARFVNTHDNALSPRWLARPLPHRHLRAHLAREVQRAAEGGEAPGGLDVGTLHASSRRADRADM